MDQIDFAIIRLLQNDARLSNKELAAGVNLSPSSCLERVRKMKAEGVFRGFHADIQEEFLGIGLQAMIAVRLTRHSRKLVETFRRHLQGMPEVLAYYHITGEHDFLVHVAVRNADHLRDLAMDSLTTREEVSQLNTHLVFEYERRPHLPNYMESDPAMPT